MNYRIGKLREYLLGIIDTLTNDSKYQINADMLSAEIDDYSLDKIPTDNEVENWIVGGGLKKDVYNFRCRKPYGQDTITNLNNIGFYEDFENIIKYNNEHNILPDIEGIESIECLNCGTLNDASTEDAVFDIQLQITYREFDYSINASM